MTPQPAQQTQTPRLPQPGPRMPQTWRFTDWAAI